MATLQYIAGQQITGADKYHLHLVIDKEAGETERIETRDVLQGFNHMGIMIDGKVKEEQRNYYFKSMDRWFGKPIRYLTEEGVKLGFRITGYVDIVGVGGFITKRGFDVICYVERELENTDVDVEVANGIAVEASVYYLQVKINKESDWRLIPIFEDNGNYEMVFFDSKENGYVTIHHVAIAESYWHTDYIYIPCLSDNIAPDGGTDRVCVGRFDLAQDLGYDKLSFYNKNLKFLGGAKVSYIAGEFGYEVVEYLTKDDVQHLAMDATGISDTTHEDYPRFVVFCSRKSGSPEDKVSVGNIYFPLFETSAGYNLSDGNKLAVSADSSNDYYTESNLSPVVTYTTNT